jgi:hypothetical protein
LWYPKDAACKIRQLDEKRKYFDKNFNYEKAVGWQV